MADESQSLIVKINLDASSATSSVTSLNSATELLNNRLSALEQSFIKMNASTSGATSSVTAHGAAHHEAADRVGETSKATEVLSGHFDELRGVTSLVQEGFEGLGIEVAGVSRQLNLAGEAIDAIGSKAPLIM